MVGFAVVAGVASSIVFLRLKTSILASRTRGESAAVLSSFFFANYLGFSTGAAVSGLLAQTFGPSAIFQAVGVFTLVVGTLGLAFRFSDSSSAR